jgi:PLD-like domain
MKTDLNLNFTENKNWSCRAENVLFKNFEVLFRNQEQRLVRLINKYKNDLIVGCVAWLTSIPILNALAKCKNVQIIVQKEDFLRPDMYSKEDSWKAFLQKKYSAVKCEMTRYEFQSPISDLSICGDPTVDGIRCLGNHNIDKSPAFPRSHHKFLVFCRINKTHKDPLGNILVDQYWPETVSTGSFNLTKNSTFSLENVIIFSSDFNTNHFVKSFLNEHHELFALSEPLDWTSDWIEPEYRIGT